MLAVLWTMAVDPLTIDVSTIVTVIMWATVDGVSVPRRDRERAVGLLRDHAGDVGVHAVAEVDRGGEVVEGQLGSAEVKGRDDGRGRQGLPLDPVDLRAHRGDFRVGDQHRGGRRGRRRRPRHRSSRSLDRVSRIVGVRVRAVDVEHAPAARLDRARHGV